MNIGNNLGKIGTVEVAGSVSMVPAIKIQRVTVIAVTFIIIDGFVKSPTSALCCISQSFNVRQVRLMITKFATPFYPAYVWRGNLNFFRNRLNWTFYEFIIISWNTFTFKHLIIFIMEV